uniref:Env polyprotein n=3 Tax=Avian leukosis virus TaxID=11864 RepID=A0A7G4P2B9_ALV|nr:envelope protein [Avian leukosis virus]QMT29815.1 envelope protein [Avian leukosis virus]
MEAVIKAFLTGYPGETSKKDSKEKPLATSKKDPEKTPLLPTRVNYILIIGVLVLCEVTGVRADVHLLEQPGNLWITWANRTGQTDFCLSTQSATSPFQTCLIGIPSPISEGDFKGYVSGNCTTLGTDRLISSGITGGPDNSTTLTYRKVSCLLLKLNVPMLDEPPELQLLGSQSLPNITNITQIPNVAGGCVAFGPRSIDKLSDWSRPQLTRWLLLRRNYTEPFTLVTADRHNLFRGSEYCGTYGYRFWKLYNCSQTGPRYRCGHVTAGGLPETGCTSTGGKWVNQSKEINETEPFSFTANCTASKLGNVSGCCGKTITTLPPGAWIDSTQGSFTKPKALPPAIFLICGDRAWQGIPSRPVGGPCYLGKLTMLAPNHTEILKVLANSSRTGIRRKRSISHLDDTCSDEVQLWGPTARIFASILAPGVAAAQALREIERLACWSVKQANLTTSLLGDLLDDVTSIRHAVLQNRAAIDFLLLAHGHGCEDVAGMCCFNLSDHSESIQKKFQLMKEHVNKIGVDSDPIGSWLRGLFGGIREWAVHLLKGLLLGLVVILLLVVCLPCLLQFVSSSIRKMINNSISYHTEYKKLQKACRQPENGAV